MLKFNFFHAADIILTIFSDHWRRPRYHRTSQRFLSQDECGVASIILILFYFYIGRLSERQISRGYERALLDSTTGSKQANISFRNRVARYFQWLWDASVPFFIQLWIYNPIRNRISYDDMTKQVVYHRSMDHRERCIFDATSCFKGNHSILSIQTLGVGSYLIGFCCFLLSFMACSPHFSVNCLTTFFCSVAYVSFSFHTVCFSPRSFCHVVLKHCLYFRVWAWRLNQWK